MVSTVVVGAGPAGLATSRELTRCGVDHVVLERGNGVGHTWANMYDGLVLHTGRHLSALPGMSFPRGTPLFPTRDDFLSYLQRYAERFRVPLTSGADVVAITRERGAWEVRTATGETLRARAVVMATGIVANPCFPAIPGQDRFRGRVMHSVEYRRPEAFAGQRLVVIGAGNSAGEISVELAAAGVEVTVAVRSGARVVPRALLGIPIQYFAVALSPLPRAAQQVVQDLTARASQVARGASFLPPPRAGKCSDVPLIGFGFVDALRKGSIRLKAGVSRFTETGVSFTDGTVANADVVMLATGYRAALGALRDGIRLDPCGFAVRRGRVVSEDQPGLYFVGHNYDTRGGLLNIARDARLAARLIAAERKHCPFHSSSPAEDA